MRPQRCFNRPLCAGLLLALAPAVHANADPADEFIAILEAKADTGTMSYGEIATAADGTVEIRELKLSHQALYQLIGFGDPTEEELPAPELSAQVITVERLSLNAGAAAHLLDPTIDDVDASIEFVKFALPLHLLADDPVLGIVADGAGDRAALVGSGRVDVGSPMIEGSPSVALLLDFGNSGSVAIDVGGGGPGLRFVRTTTVVLTDGEGHLVLGIATAVMRQMYETAFHALLAGGRAAAPLVDVDNLLEYAEGYAALEQRAATLRAGIDAMPVTVDEAAARLAAWADVLASAAPQHADTIEAFGAFAAAPGALRIRFETKLEEPSNPTLHDFRAWNDAAPTTALLDYLGLTAEFSPAQ